MFRDKKTVAERSHRVKMGYYLLVSLVIHAGLFEILTHVLNPSRDMTHTASTAAIKVRIVPAARKVTPVESPVTAKSASATRKHVGTMRRHVANTLSPQPTSSMAGHRKQQTITRYEQLFPKANVDRQIAGAGGAKNSASADPENNDKFSMAVRHVAKLTVFARELGEIVVIPSVLRQFQPSGTARVRFSRKNGKEWKVTEATGDPYLRALLFETLNNLNQETYGLVELSASDLTSVRVAFEYRTASVVDHTVKPVNARVEGNSIFIVLTNRTVDPKWQMLTVSSTGMPAFNLIGAGKLLVRHYMDKDPHDDIELRKLRLSSAYLRPIRR